MGNAIDFSTGLDEIGGINNALERLKRNEPGGKEPTPKAARPPKKPPQREASARPKLADSAARRCDDPFVNKTFKVRHSKAEKLQRLVLERKLAGLGKDTQQELLDEAMDFILGRFAVGKKRASVAPPDSSAESE